MLSPTFQLFLQMLHRARHDKMVRHLQLKSLKSNFSEKAGHEHTAMLARGVLLSNMEGITFDDLVYLNRASFFGWAMTVSERPMSQANVLLMNCWPEYITDCHL